MSKSYACDQAEAEREKSRRQQEGDPEAFFDGVSVLR
jgi:hypothetical protein